MPRKYRFVWLDVFTKTPLEGNQLAVFPDARGLTDEEMQSIARETHLSETTFVFPENDAVDLEHGFRTRIFAVMYEMPFAGHPTLGTASVLARMTGRSEVALRLKVGRIPVHFSDREGLPFGEMRQNDPEIGTTHDPRAVARALNVPIDALDPKLPIETVSTGVPFAIVPFRSLDVLSRTQPSWASMEEYLRGTDANYFYLLSRMVFQGGDDPATGSAAGPAIAWMVLHGLVNPGESVMIEQGIEVHRTSRLFARADLLDGRPVNVRVGGHCVRVIEGELQL